MALKLLKQGYRYHKLLKTVSKFCQQYYDFISKFHVGLIFLCQGLLMFHNKKIGYNIYVLQQTACLVVNPIMVDNLAFLFNFILAGPTSDSM